MLSFITAEINHSKSLLDLILADQQILGMIAAIAERAIATIQNNGKILFIGNGGSAADAQHLAAELVGRLCYERPGLPGLALTTDTSALTAIANDYDFNEIFARQILALGQAGDLLIALSTSGKSANILRALDVANECGITTVGFTGHQAPQMHSRCQLLLSVPAQASAKIQECHIVLGHIICSLIEAALYGPSAAQT
jgi:D-sedoheptulose 7-phosphate isomerase